MKKKALLLTLISVILAATLLTACGASDDVYYETASGGSAQNNAGMIRDYESYDSDIMYEYDYPSSQEESMTADRYDSGGSGIVPITAPVTDLAEKIIYSYNADIETLAFDETITNVNMLITTHNAFIESSDISGNYYANYSRGGVSYRYAHYVIRVPVGELNSLTAKLDTLGNIVSQSSNAVNITAQFTDQESRLNSLRVQEERLLDMLSKAELVEDMITIENSLANVRYQIESITSTLTNWQRQVDYSTLSLTIQEVEEYKEPPAPVNRTYWQRMGDGLISTLKGVGNFFASLFMWLIVSAPVLIILAIIAVAVIIIVRRQIRKNKANPKPPKYPYAYPPTYPQVAQPQPEEAPTAPEEEEDK